MRLLLSTDVVTTVTAHKGVVAVRFQQSKHLLLQFWRHSSIKANVVQVFPNHTVHFASSNGNINVLQILLIAGADPDRRNVWSWNAVAYSATVQSEVALKSFVAAEKEKRRQLKGGSSDGKRGAGLRMVDQDVEPTE